MFCCYDFSMSENNYFSQTEVLKHSLASPVTSLLINAELALQNVNQQHISNNFYYHLNQVRISARYVSSILQLSDSDSLQLKNSFSAKTLINETLTIAHKPNSTIQVVSYIDFPSSIKILGNKLYFQELLICILNNALESYEKKQGHRSVIITGNLINKHLVLHVSDGGKGISWLEKRKIFFYGFSRKKGHRGVGLPFAKKVIEEHFQGSMKILSKKNRGTTISLYFPISSE